MDGQLSVDERAARYKAEKDKQDAMLVVRRNFCEPSTATERKPEWLELLECKKKMLEQQQLSNQWTDVLQKHCESHQREVSRKAPEATFNASWLRQLGREREEVAEL